MIWLNGKQKIVAMEKVQICSETNNSQEDAVLSAYLSVWHHLIPEWFNPTFHGLQLYLLIMMISFSIIHIKIGISQKCFDLRLLLLNFWFLTPVSKTILQFFLRPFRLRGFRTFIVNMKKELYHNLGYLRLILDTLEHKNLGGDTMYPSM